ncbi:alpha-(1,3)-fucosyltransferase C-like [Penaeus japonicus]|uniref:alpha-(1,3)-fucosyltransferase C-like n=1 Tax=Penaeus japonicus TaxID=27405 RepID=UPI001C70DF70|nr:alpha-(1,3)-fucosyltransferase C-like [Penaeus japonicus]
MNVGENLSRKTFTCRAIIPAIIIIFAICILNQYRLSKAVTSTSTKVAVIVTKENKIEKIPDYKELKPNLKITTGPKIILFWTEWEENVPWQERFGTEADLRSCSPGLCKFTSDKNYINKAHAVLFKSDRIDLRHLPPRTRYRDQRWVWVAMESPLSPEGQRSIALLQRLGSWNINWTMTYHPHAEVLAMSGFLDSFLTVPKSLRPSLISEHEHALNSYLEDMALNKTLRDAMGVKWLDFVVRPKLLMSWFEGNCNTTSKREEYAQKLGQYVHLESYGSCGKFTCKMWGYQDDVDGCWKKYMATKYLFALVMEDYLCDHYTTQGLYRVLENGLVPIVWGGTQYSSILPPGSYIEARRYHPLDLGNLLTAIQRDLVAYGKYHLWRNYWTVKRKGSLCELCHRLHNDTTRGHHTNIPKWRRETEQCTVAPLRMFDGDKWKGVIYQ